MGPLIGGGFVYAVENPIFPGYAKEGAYFYDNRKLDSRFRVKVPQ